MQVIDEICVHEVIDHFRSNMNRMLRIVPQILVAERSRLHKIQADSQEAWGQREELSSPLWYSVSPGSQRRVLSELKSLFW